MKTEGMHEYEVRLQKLEALRKAGIKVYPDKYQKTHSAKQALAEKIGTAGIKVAGRIVSKRTMGKITFCHILDDTGKIQIVMQEQHTGKDMYKIFTDLIDIGDFLGAAGEVFQTKKGEISVLAKDYTFLGKALRPLPEKWHGLKDQEIKYRQRYLDLISNPKTRELFVFRSNFIKTLREFYHSRGFTEIETPILASTASGALAKPFTTHHHALKKDLYLRISAGEIWQKTAIIGGFEKVFELGKVFRNEGIDPSHLQEFTMVEHYAAYWNFEDNMKFTQDLFHELLKKLVGKIKIPIRNAKGEIKEVDFSLPWQKKSFRELIAGDSGIDIEKYSNEKDLLNEIKRKKINLENSKNLGLGNLIDELYKTVSRHNIIQPTFLVHHPVGASPLARRNDENPRIVDRFQLVVNGWEIVNAYSELVDPEEQEKRFQEQARAKKSGDRDAHGEDKEFIMALEHGAPPISGWGMGIDRIVALLGQADNLKDVVLFPLMR